MQGANERDLPAKPIVQAAHRDICCRKVGVNDVGPEITDSPNQPEVVTRRVPESLPPGGRNENRNASLLKGLPIRRWFVCALSEAQNPNLTPSRYLVPGQIKNMTLGAAKTQL